MLSASHEVRGESPRLSSNAKNFASHVTVSPMGEAYRKIDILYGLVDVCHMQLVIEPPVAFREERLYVSGDGICAAVIALRGQHE